MSESLRNDGRIWVPRSPATRARRTRSPRASATTSSSASTRPSATWCPATWRRATPRPWCDEGRGVGPQKNGVYLDFADAIQRLGRKTIEERYGNLFEMYEKITGEDPYKVPMRIYPAPHYTMGGLWVDYNLMSNVPGLFVIGEANFSDHGANRLGASALMQGLADGYFVMPYTIGDYLAGFLGAGGDHGDGRLPRHRGRGRGTASSGCWPIKGKRTADSFHRELGRISGTTAASPATPRA